MRSRMAELVRDTLRMNPSRVIVGEVLGDEVVTMLNAMTQGNDGSLSTIHANSSSDVVHKIATYAIQAPERLPWEATVRLVATALDFIVFIRRVRGEDGQRRVVESIREVAGISEDDQLQTNELWGPDRYGNVVRRHGVQVRAQDDLDCRRLAAQPGRVVVMAMLGFLLAVAAAASACSRSSACRAESVRCRASSSGRSLDRNGTRQLGVALGRGARRASSSLAGRWPAWPPLRRLPVAAAFGGGRAGRRQLEKIEALAAWTESLRDTATAAAGLEQAIPATVGAAHAAAAPVRELAARLDGRVPLPEALARFADDVDDPAADMVVAALSLNARQRAGGLERILTSLAASSRAELEMRRKVELERRALRRQAQRIALAVLGFIALQAVFARGWVEPYSTPLGQLVLAVLAVDLHRRIRPDAVALQRRTRARFLTSPRRRHRDRLLQAAPRPDRRPP